MIRKPSMQTKLILTAAVFGALLTAMPTLAHHSFAGEFDASHPVKLRGTVVKVELINPHSWFHIDVKQADGTLTRWMIEAGSPNVLLRNGVTKQSLPIGVEILVDGYRSRDGSNKANGRDITLPDGKKLFLGSAPGAPR